MAGKRRAAHAHQPRALHLGHELGVRQLAPGDGFAVREALGGEGIGLDLDGIHQLAARVVAGPQGDHRAGDRAVEGG